MSRPAFPAAAFVFVESPQRRVEYSSGIRNIRIQDSCAALRSRSLLSQLKTTSCIGDVRCFLQISET